MVLTRKTKANAKFVKFEMSDIYPTLWKKQKKGLNKQAFYLSCVALLHGCRKKAFEKDPLLPSGQSLLVSESPIG